MNKDVIYIDVEDDITAIIGKIKDAKEKIVALVPPKRNGVLQSAVNLRLLERMAGEADKKLVVITGNRALMYLAGSAGIPVARTLQSKPELAMLEADDASEADDVIDGDSLPVGDHARASKIPVKDSSKPRPVAEAVDDAAATLNIDDLEVPVQVAAVSGAAATKKASKVKIPNFDKFRKRIFIAVIAVVVLVGFLIWANVFAPAATIVITARTTATPVSTNVTLGDTLTTDVGKENLKTITKQIKKDQTVQFTATGTADKGNKATGTVTLTNENLAAVTVPAGTQFAANSQQFTSDSAVTVPAGVCLNTHNCHNGTADVGITATTSGTASNIDGPVAFTTNAPVTATSQDGTSGGTSNIVTVVSDSDIAQATTQLNQLSSSTYKSQLQKQFGSDDIVISDSFNTTSGTPTSSPASGQQVSSGNTATLTATTTYTLSAVSKSDVESFLKAGLTTTLSGSQDQRIYDDGISKATFTNYSASSDGTPATATINATGQIGPNIDDATIKKQSEGKIFGDVQSNLQAINGVSNVDVKFSYFWVTTVPNDPNKIRVEFQLENA